LLASKYNLPPNIVLSASAGFDNVKGALAENYVFSALTFNGYVPFYWESEGKAELDFVFQNRSGQIIPIEVKSAEHNRARSLHVYNEKFLPKLRIRYSFHNLKKNGNLLNIPVFLADWTKNIINRE